jgi:hypothetical protein
LESPEWRVMAIGETNAGESDEKCSKVIIMSCMENARRRTKKQKKALLIHGLLFR